MSDEDSSGAKPIAPARSRSLTAFTLCNLAAVIIGVGLVYVLEGPLVFVTPMYWFLCPLLALVGAFLFKGLRIVAAVALWAFIWGGGFLLEAMIFLKNLDKLWR